MELKKLHNDYDSIPVAYCAKCCSLKIIHEDYMDSDFCGECGCSDIKTDYIDRWEQLYINRYGHPYITRGDNPKDTILFKKTFDELKKLLYESDFLLSVVNELYPTFPGGLTREEVVILLFDKIAKDNRVNDLKMCIYKHLNPEENEQRDKDQRNRKRSREPRETEL